MTLILDSSNPLEPRITGVRCDRCQAEIRDPIDLGEVLHVRLRAGYGSVWGDGNNVEVDLCDACNHEVLSPFVAVTPSNEVLIGKFASGLDARRVSSLGFTLPLNGATDTSDGGEKSSLIRRIASWLIFQTRLYFVPAKVLLSPIWNTVRRFAREVEIEASKLRIQYGKE